VERKAPAFALIPLLIVAALTPIVLSKAATEADARRAIGEAELSIAQAQATIDRAKQCGAETQPAEGKLNEARSQLKVANDAYERGEYDQATNHAEGAKAAADHANALAQESLDKKIKTTTAVSTTERESKTKTSKTKTSKTKTSKTLESETLSVTTVKSVTLTDRSTVSVSRTTASVASTSSTSTTSATSVSTQTTTSATITAEESAARVEVDEAYSARTMADTALNEAGEIPVAVDLSEIQAKFDEADARMRDAEGALERGEYDEAKSLALSAKALFEQAARESESLVEAARDLLEELRSVEAVEVGVPPEVMSVLVVEGRDACVDTLTHSVRMNLCAPAVAYSAGGDEPGIMFRSTIYSLVEFLDGNGDGKVQENEILQALPLESLAWSVRSEVQEPNATVRIIYTYDTADYEFSIIINIFRSPTIQYFVFDNKTLAYLVDGNANEVKFDLSVRRWPWSSGSSKLALRLEVLAQFPGSIELRSIGKNEQWLAFEAENQTIRIKWITKARVCLPDGSEQVVDVSATHGVSANTGEILVDFVYPNFQGRTLVHDPSVGIGGLLTYQSVLQTTWMCLGLGILAAVVLTATKASERIRRSSDISEEMTSA